MKTDKEYKTISTSTKKSSFALFISLAHIIIFMPLNAKSTEPHTQQLEGAELALQRENFDSNVFANSFDQCIYRYEEIKSHYDNAPVKQYSTNDIFGIGILTTGSAFIIGEVSEELIDRSTIAPNYKNEDLKEAEKFYMRRYLDNCENDQCNKIIKRQGNNGSYDFYNYRFKEKWNSWTPEDSTREFYETMKDLEQNNDIIRFRSAYESKYKTYTGNTTLYYQYIDGKKRELIPQRLYTNQQLRELAEKIYLEREVFDTKVNKANKITKHVKNIEYLSIVIAAGTAGALMLFIDNENSDITHETYKEIGNSTLDILSPINISTTSDQSIKGWYNANPFSMLEDNLSPTEACKFIGAGENNQQFYYTMYQKIFVTQKQESKKVSSRNIKQPANISNNAKKPLGASLAIQ